MIKYFCYPTQHCNFIIFKAEMSPIFDGTNIVRYALDPSTRRKVPPNTISHLPYALDVDKVFDTEDEVKVYIKNITDETKSAHIEKIKKEIDKHQKRLEKMIDHTPSIKKINI